MHVEGSRKQTSSFFLRIINHQVFTFHFVISISIHYNHILFENVKTGCLFTDLFLCFKTHTQVAILMTKLQNKAGLHFLVLPFVALMAVWGDTDIFFFTATNVQCFSIMQFICTSCEDTTVYTYQRFYSAMKCICLPASVSHWSVTVDEYCGI